MSIGLSVYDSTAIDCPAICFPPVSGVTGHTNRSPDTANTNWVIPLHINAHSSPSRKPKTGDLAMMPLLNVSNGTTWGGHAAGVGPQELPKVSIEGFIETPTTSFTNKSGIADGRLPALIVSATTQRLTYAELISACLEGRAGASTLHLGDDWSGVIWSRVDPLWYRDPFGRVYTYPKILDFSASFVEAAPGRTTFTMQLVL